MKKVKLSNLMGELEVEIMEVVWNSGQASVRDVLLRLKKKRKVAYTTVMTVMSRLHDKKILERNLNGSGAYIYLPVHKNKQDFLVSFSRKAINNLVQSFGEELAVSQFLDFIGSKDAETVKKWQDKLKEIK
jgi:predicted transcriptional regulator